jgi:hypothetical protein
MELCMHPFNPQPKAQARTICCMHPRIACAFGYGLNEVLPILTICAGKHQIYNNITKTRAHVLETSTQRPSGLPGKPGPDISFQY